MQDRSHSALGFDMHVMRASMAMCPVGPRSAPSAGGPLSLPTLERTSSSLDEASKSEGNGGLPPSLD